MRNGWAETEGRQRRKRLGSGVSGGEAGDGLELHGVRCGWAQGQGRAMPGDHGDREIEMGEVAGVGFQYGFGADARVVLGEQSGDVVAAEGEVAGVQQRSFRAAQGGEQEDEAGEMARAKLHGAVVDFRAKGWLGGEFWGFGKNPACVGRSLG